MRVDTGREVWRRTATFPCQGYMVAMNDWLVVPTGRQVLDYVRRLYQATRPPALAEAKQVEKMKLYMIHLGPGVGESGRFLHEIRRVTTEAEFFRTCRRVSFTSTASGWRAKGVNCLQSM